MPIHIPGRRDRRGRAKGGGKRQVVAVLQLTAMVDIFSVLVVFLLQNYATTGEVMFISNEVFLPDAREVRELRPSNVVVLSDRAIMLNNDELISFREVQAQEDWLIEPLRQGIVQLIAAGEEQKASVPERLRKAAADAQRDSPAEETMVDDFKRVTIQADREMDFLSVKKVMYTVTQAGMVEINFAVIQLPTRSRQQIE